MELLEHSHEEVLEREEAAKRLRELADQLSRHNKVSFSKDGRNYTVDVPKEVKLTLEIELDTEKGDSEIEIEITW